jgi:hypothetical protein
VTHGWWWRECWGSAKRADAFSIEHGSTPLLRVQVFLAREQASRELFRKSFPTIVCIAYWHVEDSLGKTLILRVGICLDHGSHPLLKAFRGQGRDLRHICHIVLNKMVLATQIAIYLG